MKCSGKSGFAGNGCLPITCNRRGGGRQSVGEVLLKSAARSIGRQLGRQIIRGIMDSLMGGGDKGGAGEEPNISVC